jgi:hypothetical protein
MKRTEYLLPASLVQEILDVLDNHMFSVTDEDEYNNDDVIEAKDRLEALVKVLDCKTEDES